MALVCLLWGTTWLASKIGVEHMPALQLSSLRQITGGSLFLLYFAGKGRALPRGREWGPVLVLGFLNIFLSNGLSTWGLHYISSGLGAIIAAMVPLWMVIFTWIGSRSRLHPLTIVGFLLGFAGICIIFYDHLHDFLQPGFRIGIFLSIAASISWALGSLYTKDQVSAFNPYHSIGLQMLISGIALNAAAHATGQHIPLSAVPLSSWLSIAYLAVFGSVLAFTAYLYALKHLPAEQVSIYAYINPIIAVLLGSWIQGEKLNAYIMVGGVVAILGVYLVNAGFRKNQSASQ